MKRRQVISFMLVLTMILSSFTISFAGIESSDVKTDTSSVFNDVSGHWAKAAIYKWSENGVINGYQGSFRPDDTISRGEMAVILDNMMDYQIAAKNTFNDLKQDKFYTDAVLKANATGIIKGDGNKVRPTDKISREEAAVMLGRAFAIQEISRSISFNDASSIASWSKGYVAAMTAKGYLKGANNYFNPQKLITRAEIVTIIDNIVKAYYTTAGTYTDNVNGTAVIKTKDVTLKGVSISENLIIAEGVGQGDVTLDSVTVKGDTVIRGGGENSIHITGKSNITSVRIEKVGDKIRVEIADGTTVSEVEIAVGEEIVITGTVGTVQVAAADATVYATAAEIKNAEISGKNSKIVVGAQSVVENVSVATTAKNTSIEIEKGAAVKAVIASAEVKVSGTGTVTNVTLNKGADGSIISTPNTTIKVDSNVSGATTANNTPLDAGKTVTTGSDGKATTTETQKTDNNTGNKSHHDNPSINKTALTDAISAANTNKGSVTVSADGTDVLSANQWVTQGAVNAYTAAITAAQAVADKADATQAEVNAAITALAAATDTFNSGKAAGITAVTYGKKTGTAYGNYAYVNVNGLEPYVFQPTGAGSDKSSDFTNVKGMTASYGAINDIVVAINSGVFYNVKQPKQFCFNYKEPDGVVISDGIVLKSNEPIDHTMSDIFVVDEDGNIGWTEYFGNADELVTGDGYYYNIHGQKVEGKKIVSAVTGFVPILVDGKTLYNADDAALHGYDNYVTHYTSGAVRTVFGVKADGSYGILCNSTNWTLETAGLAAKAEGFVFAWNFDGGGSSEVVLSTSPGIYTDYVAQNRGFRSLPTYLVFTSDNEAPGSATPVSISVTSSSGSFDKGIKLTDLVENLTVTETLSNVNGKTSTRTIYSQQGLDISQTISHTLLGGSSTSNTEKKTGTSPNGTLYYTKNTTDSAFSLSGNGNTYQDGKYYDYSTGYTLSTSDDLSTAGLKTINISYIPGAGLPALTCTIQIALVDSGVDKTALTDAISAANTNKGSVTVSADGTDVLSANQWVIQGAVNAYTAAITAAQAVADKADATQAEVNTAITALATATDTFNSGKAAGIKPTDFSALTDAISAANTNKGSVTVSADGTDVDQTKQWVTQGAIDAYTTAITAAQDTENFDDATQAEVNAAITALAAATDIFNSAKAAGTTAIAQSLKKVAGNYSFNTWGELAS